jgi:hypothetical protein
MAINPAMNFFGHCPKHFGRYLNFFWQCSKTLIAKFQSPLVANLGDYKFLVTFWSLNWKIEKF